MVITKVNELQKFVITLGASISHARFTLYIYTTTSLCYTCMTPRMSTWRVGYYTQNTCTMYT